MRAGPVQRLTSSARASLSDGAQWWEQRTQRERLLLCAAAMLASVWLALEASSWAAAQSERLLDVQMTQQRAMSAVQSTAQGDETAVQNGVRRIQSWTVKGATPQIASLPAVSGLRQALAEAGAATIKVDSWRLGKTTGPFTPIIITVVGDYDRAMLEGVLAQLQRADISFELISIDVMNDPAGARLRASFQALHSHGAAR